MKLYLTSERMGDDSDRLLAMITPRGRVAVVSNALDLISEEARRAYAARGGFVVHDWFRNHGLEVIDLDLRTYFNNGSIDAALDRVDLVWATGGNSFLLLRAIRQSGLEVSLKRRLAENSITYGGWSAGACVAGSSLRGIHLMDDPVSVANGYDPEPQMGWHGARRLRHRSTLSIRASGVERCRTRVGLAGTAEHPVPHLARRGKHHHQRSRLTAGS